MTMPRSRLVCLLALALVLCVAACDDDATPMPDPLRIRQEPKDPATVRVMFGGDTMLDDLALPYLLKYGWEYPLASLQPLFARADVVAVNLEVPVVAHCQRDPLKKYAYYMKPAALTGLTGNGVRFVNLANNHFMDCGAAGEKAMLANLDRAGIYHFGGGLTSEDALRPLIVEIGDTKIGLIGLFGYKSVFDPSRGTAPANKANVRGLVAGLRPLVDVLIVTFHWGENYVAQIDDKQTATGRLALDSGADIVIGHGPHMPQAMETYRGKPLIYSVGNCAFGTGNDQAAEALLAEMEITGRKLTKVILHPLFTQNRNLQVRWQTRLLPPARARRFLEKWIGEAKGGGDLRLVDNRVELNLAGR